MAGVSKWLRYLFGGRGPFLPGEASVVDDVIRDPTVQQGLRRVIRDASDDYAVTRGMPIHEQVIEQTGRVPMRIDAEDWGRRLLAAEETPFAITGNFPGGVPGEFTALQKALSKTRVPLVPYRPLHGISDEAAQGIPAGFVAGTIDDHWGRPAFIDATMGLDEMLDTGVHETIHALRHYNRPAWETGRQMMTDDLLRQSLNEGQAAISVLGGNPYVTALFRRGRRPAEMTPRMLSDVLLKMPGDLTDEAVATGMSGLHQLNPNLLNLVRRHRVMNPNKWRRQYAGQLEDQFITDRGAFAQWMDDLLSGRHLDLSGLAGRGRELGAGPVVRTNIPFVPLGG